MSPTRPEQLLAKLEDARSQIGVIDPRHIERLLQPLFRTRIRRAASLIRFHDVLLFLSAFPPSQRVLKLSQVLLTSFESRVKAALKAGEDPEEFAPEEVVGIAGTVVEGSFSFDLLRRLVVRYPHALSINWEGYERDVQMASVWPRLFPLMEEDSLTEANVPYLKWLQAARGRESELLWLLRSFQNLSQHKKENAGLYDSLELLVRWEMSSSPASRTLARRPVRSIYYHRTPLIRRRQISLADSLAQPQLLIKKVSRKQGEKILDMVQEATAVRYRELYGITLGDPRQVLRAEVGRGVEIYLWGLSPERRLPLRAYLAGFTLKNGAPINYIEGISLFDWMEIGFNTFFAYRDGETAWVYAQVLRLLRQLHGVNAISVYPYQIGDHNEEAIASGAFWFYRKLGFRPMRPELAQLTEAEEKKITKDSGYRTPAQTLRRLSQVHVVYETPDAVAGAWDSFSMRNIGYEVQRRMAREFNGDAGEMLRATIAIVSKTLAINVASFRPLERTAFENLALILALVPDLSRWTKEEKAAVLPIVRAKVAATEQRYMKLLKQHQRLRRAILRLGSKE